MRSVLFGLLATSAMACGVFSSSDDSSPTEAPPPPSTPQDNATPPPIGGQAPVGVYVSSSQGQDDGSGSSVRPLKTLASAFAKAKEQGLRVIACAEEYTENVTLLDGVSAYGYYDCKKTPWERGAPRAVIRAAASPAVFAKGITQPTRLEGFEVRSPDGVSAPGAPAGSSVGVELHDAKSFVLSESLVHAGKGADGTDGEMAPVNVHLVGGKGADGVERAVASCNPILQNCDKQVVPGPLATPAACTVGTGGAGGGGGAGTWYSELGPAYPGAPYFWNGKPLAPGSADTASGGGPGVAGTSGSRGADGPDGANGKWALGEGGFLVGDGTTGTAGKLGQGGGGGGGAQYYNGTAASPNDGSSYHRSSTGGSGGAGGCPGQTAKPGTGGGASLGVVVFGGEVSIERSRIETSAGGRAGRGFFGSNGGVAGGGGLAATLSGKGGDGGRGGTAGFSGHGAPGPSIALAYKAPKPALDTVDLAPGAGGAGWPEATEMDGARVKLLPAVVGESKAEHGITQ